MATFDVSQVRHCGLPESILRIKGLTSASELDILHRLAQQAPSDGHVVELGTFQGRTAATLCHAVGPARVVTIDHWRMQHHGANSPDIARQNLSILGFVDPPPRLITGLTTDIPPDIQSVALLFIDSDHQPAALAAELAAWEPYLRPGAIVALHDYGDPRYSGFTAAIDRHFERYERLTVVEHLVAFRKPNTDCLPEYSVTVCLLNWRRPANLRVIVDSIRLQTVPTKVFLWNNGDSELCDFLAREEVDWWIDSSRNVGCHPRWFMAQQAETGYVCTLDDDLLPCRSTLFSDAICFLESRREPGTIIGPFGVVLTQDGYQRSHHIGYPPHTIPSHDLPVDIVKGRHMFMRTTELQRCHRDIQPTFAEDDIAVSAAMARRDRRRHWRPSLYDNSFTSLPCPHGLEARPEHYSKRNTIARDLFSV